MGISHILHSNNTNKKVVLWLQVPNGIGFVLGIAQLLLYAIYSREHNNKSSKTSSDELENEWQIREPFVSSSTSTNMDEKNHV